MRASARCTQPTDEPRGVQFVELTKVKNVQQACKLHTSGEVVSENWCKPAINY